MFYSWSIFIFLCNHYLNHLSSSCIAIALEPFQQWDLSTLNGSPVHQITRTAIHSHIQDPVTQEQHAVSTQRGLNWQVNSHPEPSSLLYCANHKGTPGCGYTSYCRHLLDTADCFALCVHSRTLRTFWLDMLKSILGKVCQAEMTFKGVTVKWK